MHPTAFLVLANDRIAELAADTEARGRPDRLVELRRRLDVGDTDPEMVDVAAVSQRAVMDGLDAVPVGIEQEGAVVVVAVLRPRAGLAVALVPGGRPSQPERVDVLP